MLHPDKAHGLQANDRSRNPVLLRAMLLVLFLGAVGLSMPGLAKTTVLQEVRMGNHDAYVRIVFEFSDAVQYQVSENTSNRNCRHTTSVMSVCDPVTGMHSLFSAVLTPQYFVDAPPVATVKAAQTVILHR